MSPPEQAPAPAFVVTGRRRSGVVTYRCPTPEWALRKLTDFDRAGYTDIAVKGPDGRPIGQAELTRLVERAERAGVDSVSG